MPNFEGAINLKVLYDESSDSIKILCADLSNFYKDIIKEEIVTFIMNNDDYCISYSHDEKAFLIVNTEIYV